MWLKAKKDAEKAATEADKKNGDKSKKQANAFGVLQKKSFKRDLGPNLDKWVKLFPDYPEMNKLMMGSIIPVLKAYERVTKSSGLDASIQKLLTDALNEISKLQPKRNAEAKKLVESDVDLAIKESKKKIPPPIVVFKHPDIMRPVEGKVGELKNIKINSSLSVEVIISDKEILSNFPADSNFTNQAQKIKDAGDFDKCVEVIAADLKVVDKNVGDGKSLAAKKKILQDVINKAIYAAAERATEEAGRQGNLKGKAKWAKIKQGGTLTLAFAGAAAGMASLALTPFTFGVSTVAGCIGLTKSSLEIARQLRDIARTAEMMADSVAKDLNTLEKQYSKWLKNPQVKETGGVSDKMGMAELAKRGLNALAPTDLKTLKSVRSDVDTYGKKVDELEVKANNLGDNLDKWLRQQEEATNAFKKIQELGKDALPDKEFKQLLAILRNIEKTTKEVSTIITSVTHPKRGLNARVAKNQKECKRLSKEIESINIKNPRWSEIGGAIFEVSASVANTFAASINAPEAVRQAKATLDVIGAIDTAREQMQQTSDLADNLKDAITKQKTQYLT